MGVLDAVFSLLFTGPLKVAMSATLLIAAGFSMQSLCVALSVYLFIDFLFQKQSFAQHNQG